MGENQWKEGGSKTIVHLLESLKSAILLRKMIAKKVLWESTFNYRLLLNLLCLQILKRLPRKRPSSQNFC